MRTTLNLDEEALTRAMEVASAKTKTAVINEALRDFARRRDVRGFLKWKESCTGKAISMPCASGSAENEDSDRHLGLDRLFNGYESPERQAVAGLVAGAEELCTCGVIVAEVFRDFAWTRAGKISKGSSGNSCFLNLGIEALPARCRSLSVLRTESKTVRSTIDCLIAVLAEENGCCVSHETGI